MAFTKAKAFILSVIVLLSISSASILVLLASAPSSVVAYWRVFLSFIILLIVGILTNSGVFTRVYNVRDLLMAFLSGFFLAFHFLLWMESLFHVPVAVSTTIVVSYPLINLMIDKLLFRENVKFIQYLGLFTGFLGISLFFHPFVSRDYSLYGALLALLGSIAASLYFSIGRYLRKRMGLIDYVVPVYGFASITLLMYNVVNNINLFNYSLRSYMFFVMLACIPMIGGHTLMNYMLKYMKSSTVTAIALGEPIGASILAYMFLGQTIDYVKALLMTIVILSVFIVVWSEEPGSTI